jgi:hypothetical protein
MTALPPDTWTTVLSNWQTLVTGILAIVAAFIGGGFVYYQTRTAQAADRDRLARRHAAARSTLPLVLSGMMEYARHVAAGLRRLYLSSVDDAVTREAIIEFEIPPLPTDATRALSEVIEAASNEMAEVISNLLSQLQVQNVRLRGMRDDAIAGTPGRRNLLKIELDTYIGDVADIYARCEGLLGYARRETDTANADPSGEALQRALFLTGFHEGAFDRVKEAVQRRAQREGR